MEWSSDVIVWALRGLIEDVYCSFQRRPSSFLLTIERAGERLLEEEYASFLTMMARARELRSSLLRVGFTPTGADGVPAWQTDSLLHNFVRVGIAPFAAAGQRPS